MNHSDLRESDLPSWEGNGKGALLKSFKKLLIRGAVGDILMSGTRVRASVVTRCIPAAPLIETNDQVFLQAKDRGLIEKFIETGEMPVIDANQGTMLDKSGATEKTAYQLAIHSSKLHGIAALNFFDAKQDAEQDHSFQADFDDSTWKPEWRFNADSHWFSRLRDEVLENWFQTLGKNKQLRRSNNVLMQISVSNAGLQLLWNMSEHGDPASATFDLPPTPATIATKPTMLTFFSKDVAPVLYNIADADCTGSIEISGNAGALCLQYATKMGDFLIAVPTVAATDGAQVRQSTQFRELRYG